MGCGCNNCKCGKEANDELIEQIEDQTKPFIQEEYSIKYCT